MKVLTVWRAGRVLGADTSLNEVKQKIQKHLVCHLLGPGSAWTSSSGRTTLILGR